MRRRKSRAHAWIFIDSPVRAHFSELRDVASLFGLMLGGFGWSSKQSGPTLVLEPIAFAINADNSRVMKDANRASRR
jgi:hypothetical protein